MRDIMERDLHLHSGTSECGPSRGVTSSSVHTVSRCPCSPRHKAGTEDAGSKQAEVAESELRAKSERKGR